MNSKKFEQPQVDVKRFSCADIIAVSDGWNWDWTNATDTTGEYKDWD